MKTCIAALILLLCPLLVDAAQKPVIAGQITDSSGAVIPNAKLFVRWDPVSSQVDRTAGFGHDLAVTANEMGLYEVQVPAGFYDIFVSSPAFTPAAAKVRVRDGQRTTFNAKLSADPQVTREIGDQF